MGIKLAIAVSYGDRYPVTTEGRVVGIVLMIGGVGMLAGLSGLVASLFLGRPEQKPDETKEILARLNQMETKLDAIIVATRTGEPPK